jgi:HEAT repeat protein
MFALASIGPEALPTMKGVVTNFDRESTLLVVACIEKMGTNARPLVPLLLPHLQSTNWFVAMITTRTLGQLQFDPELVVPALTKCMDDSRYEVRMETPRALMQFGELARPALPALVKALGDTNADVRRNAAEAIKKIDRGTLTNAPAL